VYPKQSNATQKGGGAECLNPKEFKEEAVALVREQGYIARAARKRVGVPQR